MRVLQFSLSTLAELVRNGFVYALLAFWSCELTAQSTGDASALAKGIAGVDWKKIAREIPGDPEFQSSVRKLFVALTPDGQRKVAETVKSLKEGNGPLLTATPIDSVVRTALSKVLLPFVTDTKAKAELTLFIDSGDLAQLLHIISSAGKNTPPRVGNIDPAGKGTAEFVGREWQTLAGSVFFFEAEKKGFYKRGQVVVSFEWRKRGDIITAKSGQQEWYFRFENDEALFGLSLSRIDQKLVLPTPEAK